MQLGNASSLSHYQKPQVSSQSAEGPAQLPKPQQAAEERSLEGDLNSFAHGALGMDHPERIEAMEDPTYSAGQYLKAALTVGGVLLAIA